MTTGWIGVDFDGTLAVYVGNQVLGPPIPRMVARVKDWLAKGREVRIFTIRVSFKDTTKNAKAAAAIKDWCVTHIGQALEVTCSKDFGMAELWDDKAITVVKNTGMSWREYYQVKRRTR